MSKCKICNEETQKNNHKLCHECYTNIGNWFQALSSLDINQLIELTNNLTNAMIKSIYINSKTNYQYQICMGAITWVIQLLDKNIFNEEKYFIFIKKFNEEYNKLSKTRDVDPLWNKKHSNFKENFNRLLINLLNELNSHLVKQKSCNLSNDYRKNYEAEFRTSDGHYVRSQAEMLIDNWLYENNILHEYEKSVIIDGIELHPDFYLKSINTYIEYFGFNNEHYKQQSENKKELYKENNLNCIFLYPNDIKNLGDILQKEIFKRK